LLSIYKKAVRFNARSFNYFFASSDAVAVYKTWLYQLQQELQQEQVLLLPQLVALMQASSNTDNDFILGSYTKGKANCIFFDVLTTSTNTEDQH